MRFYALLFFVGLFLCFSRKAYAQPVTITYPSSAENITRSFGAGLLTVKIVFNGACSGATSVRVAFPSSVSYVSGSVNKTGGTSALGITESSISDLSNPVFAISGITASGDEIVFQVARIAACGTLTTAKDSIFVVTSGGCSNTSEIVGTKNTYNILAPSLSITPAASLTGGVLDTTLNRSSTIYNGGNGVTDTVRFFIVYPSSGIVNTSGTNTISANSVSFAPYTTSGDTLFYKIYGSTVFSGDSLFSNGETVTIVEPIKVAKCAAHTYYGVAWGKNGVSICSWSYGNTGVVMASGNPNLGLLTTAQVGFTDKCTPYTYETTYKNGGTGVRKASTMYDVELWQGARTSSVLVLANLDTNLFSISDVKIGSTSLVYSFEGRRLKVDLKDQLSADPDGGGVGLEDVDGDGYYDDLPPGYAVKISAKLTLKCDISCGVGKANNGIAGQVKYHTMCDISQVSSDVVNGSSLINYISETGFLGTTYLPANVIDGVPFRINLRASYSSNGDTYSSSNTRYRWKIVLPSGFSLASTPAATYGTSSVSYTTSMIGDTISYTSSSNSLDSFNISLVYSCGTGGTKSIYYSLEKINNISSACKCQGDLICAYALTNAFCPTTCLKGPSTYVPKVRRSDSCIGYTNYSLSSRVSTALISDYDLSKALYLDTIQILGAAVQHDSASNLYVELTLPKTTFYPTGDDKLSPVNIVASFYRSGSLKTSCTVSSYSSAASTSSTQSVVFDLSSCVSTLGGLLPNDSVYVKASFVVAVNDNLPKNDVQSGESWTFYNKNSSGTKVVCNTTVPEMYLVGTDILNATNAYITSGCSSATIGGSTNYIARRFNSAGELFQKEFRPVMYVDSIVADIPSGYTWNYTHFQPTSGPTYTYLTPTVSGTKYSFTNPGTWQALGLTVSNAYGGYIPFNLSPTCATQSLESINFKIYIRDFYYAYVGKSTPSGLAKVLGSSSGQTRNIAYTASQKPDIVLIDQTGTARGVKGSMSWNIRLYNKGLSTAPYTWLAVPIKSTINVTKVTELSSGDTMVPLIYGSGVWYKLSTAGVASGAYTDYKLDFDFSSCNPDSLKILAGWNCSGYPADPDTYVCDMDSLYLKVAPEPSQVQLSVLRQPGAGSTVDLCTTDSILLAVNSAQSANLLEPYVVIYPPVGFNVSTPVKVEYPLGSGDYQNATVTSISGGGLKIDLTAHSSIATAGILGTALSSASYTPLGGDRQAKIKLDYTTDCDLTSGYSFVFYAYGKMPCGIPALGNGVSATTSAINITGATTSGTAGAVINIAADSFSCGTSSTISLSAVPTGMSTQVGDTMIYVLPSGLGYAGSFVRGTNCDSCEIKVESGSAGSTVVKVKLKTGVAASSSLEYSFDVIPKGGGCSSVSINGYYKRLISSLMCGSVYCTSSSVFIATFSSPAVLLKKPSLQIDDYQLLDTNVWLTGGSLNKVKLKYSNTGSLAYPANTDSVELFCGASTSPFAILPLTKSLAIGDADSDIYYVSIPATACAAGDLVSTKAKIQTLTTNNTYQCLCDSSVKILNVKPSVPDSVIYCQWATAVPLTASGTSLKWYTSPLGGLGSSSAPTPSTTTPGAKSYYVSQTSSTGVEGPRAEIVVYVNRTPEAPVVSSPINYCQGVLTSMLSATASSGDTLLWYTSASGGTPSLTAPVPSSAVPDTLVFYVSAKSSKNCEGPRDSIQVLINRTPVHPTTVSPVVYCQGDSTSVLTASISAGDTLLWYTSASGGIASLSAPKPSSALAGTTTYYMSAKSPQNCEGPRDSIKVVVNRTPDAPSVSSPVEYCLNATPSPLTASKYASDTLLWYTIASGGVASLSAPIPPTDKAIITTYYVSAKSMYNCEGPRDSIVVIVHPLAEIPRVSSPIVYCQFDSALQLEALKTASDTLLWYAPPYTSSTTVAPIPSTVDKGVTVYYVSAKSKYNCEGLRDSISVVVNYMPDIPIVTSPVSYCKDAVASALSALSADTILWYTSASGGVGSISTPTPSTATVGKTVYYVSAKSSSNCESARDSIVVYVNDVPGSLLVSSPVTYCQGDIPVALTASKSALDTLLWYTSASGGAASRLAPVPSTSTVGSTTYYVSAKNAPNCEGPRDSIQVVVNRTPGAPSVVSPVVYCQGSTAVSLSAGYTSGDTLLWYATASGGIGSTTAPTPSTSTIGTTTYYVSAKSALNCEGPRDSIQVVVNRTPETPSVVSPVVYCQGSTAVSLSAGYTSGDTLLWYTSASGGVGTTTAPTPSTASVGTIAYYVSAKSALHCEGPRDSIQVVVNRTPSLPLVLSPVVYCQGETAVPLGAVYTIGDTLLWYTSASGGVGTSTAPTPLTSAVGTTTYYVSAKSALNCEGKRDSVQVVVNRTPDAPTVVSPVVYCQGASVSPLSAGYSSGDTLLWYTSATGGIGTKMAPTPGTATVGTTTYYVSAKSALNCEGPRDSIQVVINRTPTVPSVVSPLMYCLGASSTVLSAGYSAGDTLLWYTTATGGVGTTTAPSPSTASVGVTTYYVSAKSVLNCEGPRDSIQVQINPIPTVPTVISPVMYCQGGLASALTAGAGIDDTLLWYTTATGGMGSTIAPVPSTASVGATVYYVSVKSKYNCEGPRDSIRVVVNYTPDMPVVTSPVSYCKDAVASPLSAASADTVLWYTSASGGVGSLSTPTPSTSTVGKTVYYVSAKSPSNCESVRDSIVVYVNDVPGSPLVTSPVTYCQGDIPVALTASKSVLDTLLWYTSASGGVASRVAPVPSASTVGATTYYVSAKNAPNCEGPRDSIQVVVNRTPGAPIVVSPLVYCQGSTAVSLSASYTSGDTLLWYTSASGGVGSTIAPTPSTSTIGTTTYYVSAKSALNCEGPRDSIQVVVNRTPETPSVVSPVVYCQGSSALSLNAGYTLGDTLLWYTSASGGVGTSTAPTPSTSTVGTTTYYVSAKSILNCEGRRDSIAVVINPTPLAPSVISPVYYCQYDSAMALTASKMYSSDTLAWYTASTGGTLSYTAPVPVTSFSGSYTYYVSLINAYACEGPRANIIVNVNPAPAPPLVAGTVVYCEGDSTLALSATGSSLKWYASATTDTFTTIAPKPSSMTPGVLTYYVSQTDTATGCESQRVGIDVVVHPKPAPPIVSSPLELCFGGVGDTLEAVGTNLKWYTSLTTTLYSTSAPIVGTATIGTTAYYVSQTSDKGCESVRAKLDVVVNPLPDISISSLAVSGFVYCKGRTITLKATADKAESYQWYYEGTMIASAVADTVVADTLGLWGVRVWDSLGCDAYKEVRVYKDTTSFPVLSPAGDIYKCEETDLLLTTHPGYVGYVFQLYYEDMPKDSVTNKENMKTVRDSGTYYVVVTNFYGCDDTTNKTRVLFYPKPIKPVISLAGTWLETYGVYRHYQWYKNDTKEIGAHATKYNTTGPGYYFLEVTDENGCLNQSDTIYIGNLSVGGVSGQYHMKLYPNPSAGKVFIESPFSVRLEIFDALGRSVYKEKNVSEVDMSDFADGTYMFYIRDEEGVFIVNEKVTKYSQW